MESLMLHGTVIVTANRMSFGPRARRPASPATAVIWTFATIVVPSSVSLRPTFARGAVVLRPMVPLATLGKVLPNCFPIKGKRSEEHTSDSSHGYISYAVFCLKQKNNGTPDADTPR